MSRRQIWLAVTGAVLFLLTVIAGPYVSTYEATQAASRSSQNSCPPTAAPTRNCQELAAIQTVVNLIQQATGEPAQKAQAAQLTRLVNCLYNRVDFDTGRARLDPTCNLTVLVPTPTTAPAHP